MSYTPSSVGEPDWFFDVKYDFTDAELSTMGNALTITFNDPTNLSRMLGGYNFSISYIDGYDKNYDFFTFPSKNKVKISYLNFVKSVYISVRMCEQKSLLKSYANVKMIASDAAYPSLNIGGDIDKPYGYGSICAGGDSSYAIGLYSLSVGSSAKSIGNYSQALGNYVIAQGTESHAEGRTTRAYGVASHSEGDNTIAVGSYSHAGGSYTSSENYASMSIGKYNKKMTAGVASTNTNGDALVIGNGTKKTSLSNAFRVTFGGGGLRPLCLQFKRSRLCGVLRVA